MAFRILLTVVLAVSLTGCLNTMQSFSRSISGGVDLEAMLALPKGSYPQSRYDVELATVVDAVRYGLEEAGLKVVHDEATSTGHQLIGELPAAMQSWGQFVRIDLSSSDDVALYYDSRRTVAGNITEDLGTIKKNVMLLIDDYIELASTM